jgi:hypothetical protein
MISRIYVASECADQLGLRAGRHNLEFIDDLEPVENSAQSGGIVVCVSLATNGEALATYRGRFGE